MGTINDEVSSNMVNQLNQVTSKYMIKLLEYLENYMKMNLEKKERQMALKLLDYQKSGGSFYPISVLDSAYPTLQAALERENIPIVGFRDSNSNSKLCLIRESDREKVEEILHDLQTIGKVKIFDKDTLVMEKSLLFKTGDEAVLIKGLNKMEYDELLNNLRYQNSKFPIAPEINEENDIYNIYIKKSDICKENGNDFLSAYSRTMLNLYGSYAIVKDHEVEYEQKLQDSCVNYCKKSKYVMPKYLVSSKYKNAYIELSGEGIVIYTKEKDKDLKIDNYKELKKISINEPSFKELFEKEFIRLSNCVLVDKIEEVKNYIENDELPNDKYLKAFNNDKKIAKEKSLIEKKWMEKYIDKFRENRKFELAQRKMSLSDVSQVENISAFFNDEVSIGEFLEHELVNEVHIKEEEAREINNDMLTMLKNKYLGIEVEDVEITREILDNNVLGDTDMDIYNGNKKVIEEEITKEETAQENTNKMERIFDDSFELDEL